MMVECQKLSTVLASHARSPDDYDEKSSGSPSSPKLTLESDLEEDLYPNDGAASGNLEKSYELTDLQRHRDSRQSQSIASKASKASSERYENSGQHERYNSSRRRSDGTVDYFMLYTPVEERAIVKMFDRRLVLFMALLYMLSFLDRSNIGNARIAGLSRDLKLSSSQYEWLLTAFYITYILFEWMTLLYRLVPPHIYISVCVLSWGIIASLQSLVTSFPLLLCLRSLLGVGEAAFGPGLPFYLSFFFKREELALRTGLFISAAPLSISFASSLAWLITKIGKNGPIAPWRLLFLVEGFPSVVIAVFVWMYVPDSPEQAVYLTRREKKVARLRLQKGKTRKQDEYARRGLRWKQVLQTLADPKCYVTALMFFSCNVAFSSMPVFLPTIIEEMGYPAQTSQALSAPPYLLSFLTILVTSYLSDLRRSRSPFITFHATLAFLGYTLIALGGYFRLSAAWRYVGIYGACVGFFNAITIIITWTMDNQEETEGKGAGMVMLNVLGQCGPLVGTRLYPDTDKPYYVLGMSICAAFMLAVGVLANILKAWLRRENNQRDQRCGSRMVGGDDGIESLVSKEEEDRFRFIL